MQMIRVKKKKETRKETLILY